MSKEVANGMGYDKQKATVLSKMAVLSILAMDNNKSATKKLELMRVNNKDLVESGDLLKVCTLVMQKMVTTMFTILVFGETMS